MTTHFRILLCVAVALNTFSAASLHAQLTGPMEVSVVTGKVADGNVETTTLTGHRRQRFQYTIGSFKPIEISSADFAAPDMMGGGMAGMGGEAIGGGGMMGGGMMGGPGSQAVSNAASQSPLVISILAFVLDERQEDGRAKIELLTDFYAVGIGHYSVAGSMMGMGREPSFPVNIGTYRRLSELADQTGASSPADAHLTPEEFQIVSQICQLKIWKADAVQAIQLAEHAPEAGVMAEKEQHLKQLLTEEFDVQLARQEIEVRTIEQRTAALKQEIERRRQAKDRVIDVQLGRIVLEAQGLLGR